MPERGLLLRIPSGVRRICLFYGRVHSLPESRPGLLSEIEHVEEQLVIVHAQRHGGVHEVVDVLLVYAVAVLVVHGRLGGAAGQERRRWAAGDRKG